MISLKDKIYHSLPNPNMVKIKSGWRKNCCFSNFNNFNRDTRQEKKALLSWKWSLSADHVLLLLHSKLTSSPDYYFLLFLLLNKLRTHSQKATQKTEVNQSPLKNSPIKIISVFVTKKNASRDGARIKIQVFTREKGSCKIVDGSEHNSLEHANANKIPPEYQEFKIESFD